MYAVFNHGNARHADSLPSTARLDAHVAVVLRIARGRTIVAAAYALYRVDRGVVQMEPVLHGRLKRTIHQRRVEREAKNARLVHVEHVSRQKLFNASPTCMSSLNGISCLLCSVPRARLSPSVFGVWSWSYMAPYR